MGVLQDLVGKPALKAIGKAFKIATEADEKCFDELWQLYKAAEDFKKNHGAEMEAEVDNAFKYLRGVADGRHQDKAGFRHVKRLPVDQNYVILSDHHIAFPGHLHNFFRKNEKLYRTVLAQYYAKDYSLIENGDVFELVIFNPVLAYVKELVAKLETSHPWREIIEYRRQSRLSQLEKIIAHYGDSVFGDVARTFHAAGRYFPIVGNHDRNLLESQFHARLAEVYPGISVTEVIALCKGDKYPKFLITHGHQFDVSCHPTYANRVGEAISEALSWAFQGADRIWKWDDDARRWTKSRQPFRNKLVTGEPEGQISEELLNHEVAWEYFESDSELGAITNEVCTGDEFFKFRHLNECNLKTRLCEVFQDAPLRPTLILGHTHEVRHCALDGNGAAFSKYANCGSVGRFENLLWGLEIENRECRVVSWHYSDWPDKGNLVRLVYDSQQTKGSLVPSDSHVPL